MSLVRIAPYDAEFKLYCIFYQVAISRKARLSRFEITKLKYGSTIWKRKTKTVEKKRLYVFLPAKILFDWTIVTFIERSNNTTRRAKAEFYVYTFFNTLSISLYTTECSMRADVSEINSIPILFIQLLNNMFMNLQTQFVLYS